MISREEIKNEAKQQIRGKIGMLFICMLLMVVIAGASDVIPLAVIVIQPPMMLGSIYVYLDICAGGEVDINRLFAGFKRLGQSICLFLLISVYTFLWSLLFVIPGIIKAISYSQSFYILAEHPEMTASEALRESMEIMEGHKWKYVVLYLSFIGWVLLGAVTCGIAFIWVKPYMSATLVNYYHRL
ncbi:MAG TPA: DUF975 family protein [Lachnospiraceae bacterium]|nr:DUF975 family protein [Lachnospiraceae bacterium]